MAAGKWAVQAVILMMVLVAAVIASQWAGHVARATGSERLAEAHRHVAVPSVMAVANDIGGKARAGTVLAGGQDAE